MRNLLFIFPMIWGKCDISDIFDGTPYFIKHNKDWFRTYEKSENIVKYQYNFPENFDRRRFLGPTGLQNFGH